MQPFLVIQCLTEHVDIVLSHYPFAFVEQKHFKNHTQIRLCEHRISKPYPFSLNVPYAIIKDGLVDEAYFIKSNGLLANLLTTQSLMQAKSINWKVQKERMKVLNLLKITG